LTTLRVTTAPINRNGELASLIKPRFSITALYNRQTYRPQMASITRARKSSEYGLGIDCLLRVEMPVDSLPPIQPDRTMLFSSEVKRLPS
jgi:hypothetical protein